MSHPTGKDISPSGIRLQRFILWRLLLVVLTPMLLVALVSLWQAHQQLQEKARAQLEARADHQADLLQHWLSLRLADAQLYAHGARLGSLTEQLAQHWAKSDLSAEDFIATPLWQRIHQTYQQRANALTLHDQLFHNLLLIGKDGTVLFASQDTPLLGKNVLTDSLAPSLRHAVETVFNHGLDHLADTAPQMDGEQLKYTTWYVAELDQDTGLVALQLDFSRLTSLLRSDGRHQRSLLINEDGQLRSPLPAFESEPNNAQSISTIIEQALAEGWHQYQSFDGVDVIGITRSIIAGDHAWFLLTEMPASQLAMPTTRLLQNTLLYLLLALVFSVLAAIILARHLSTPIKRLRDISTDRQVATADLASTGIEELDQVQAALHANAIEHQQQDELIRDSLLKSHRHLATLSDQKAALNEHCIMLFVDGDGMIRDANQDFCKLIGYSPQELLDQPLANITPSPFGATEWHIERAIQQGKKWNGVVHGHDRRHQSFWLKATVIPLSRNAGTMYVCTDITSQERTQQTLNELHPITSDSSLELTQRINAMLELGCRMFELPIGIVSQINANTYTVRYVHVPEHQISIGDSFKLGDTYCSLTLSANSPKAYHHAGASEIADHPCYKNFQLEAYLGCPLLVQGQRYGTVNFSSPDARLRPFTDSDLELVQLITQWIGNEISRDQGRVTLQRHDRVLKQVSEQARIGGWELDVASGQLYWSAMTRLIHRVPDNFQPSLDEGIEFYKPGHSRERIQVAIDTAIKDGTPWNEILQIITHDGQEVWVQARGQAEFNGDQCVRLYGSFQDVNDTMVEKQRNDLVLKSTAVGIWDWHIPSGATVFNDRWAEIVGYQLDELEPINIDTWLTLAHPEDLPESERLLNEHWQGNSELYICEARMRHKDGHWIWVLDTGKVVEWDDDGKPVRMIGTHLDISERKYAEQQLADSNYRLSLARDAAGLGVWDFDLTTGQLEWDEGMFHIYGISEQEFQHSVNDWRDRLHPADSDRAAEEFKTCLENHTPFASEFRIISHPDGLRHIKANAYTINDDKGQPIRVIGTNYDITDLRIQQQRSERALSMVEASMEATDNGVLVTTIEGEIVRWNQRFIEMWRLQPEEIKAVNHQRLLQFIVPQLRNTKWVDQQMQELYANPEQGAFDLIECLDGRIFERSSLPMLLNHRAIGRVWNYRDITAQQRNQKALLEARQQAEAALVAKSQFLASMSHEIRTPMNGVLGMLELLRNTPLTEEQQHRINLARSSAQALLNLINDILDFSKIEAQKLTIHNERFDLVDMASDCVEGLAQLAQDKGLEIVLDTSAIECRDIMGDEGRCRQVLTNLVGNAIKFTEEGEVEVRLATHQSHEQPCRIDVQVRDTGIGIAPSDQAALFEAFSQIDASNTRKFGGTGLGLAIVQQLLTLMDGGIEVDSEAGQGSIFKAHWMAPEAWSRELGQQAQKSVLIISPHESQNRATIAMLKRLNAGSSACNDIKHATQLLQQQVFDCVLISTELALQEDASGQVASLQLKQRFGVRQILMTPMRFHSEPKALKHAGIDWWFPIPTTEQDLARALGDSSKHQHQLHNSIGQGSWQHLLLVEDNQVNQLVASELLGALGYRISVANHGQEALDILNRCDDDPIQLVLMDCQMPVLDGYDTTRSIRQGKAGDNNRDIPIIAMTANAMEGDRQSCLDAGMNDYLSKPVNVTELQNKVLNWLGQSYAHKPAPAAKAKPQQSTPTIAKRAKTQQPVWQKNDALKRLMGNENLLKKLITLFVGEQPKRLIQMQQAVEQQQLAELATLSHTLKGAAGNLGAAQLQQAASELEQGAKAPDGKDIDALWQSLQQASDAFMGAIDPGSDSTPDATDSTDIQLSNGLREQLLKLHKELELANYIDISEYPVLDCQANQGPIAQQLFDISKDILNLDTDSAQARLKALLESSETA